MENNDKGNQNKKKDFKLEDDVYTQKSGEKRNSSD